VGFAGDDYLFRDFVRFSDKRESIQLLSESFDGWRCDQCFAFASTIGWLVPVEYGFLSTIVCRGRLPLLILLHHIYGRLSRDNGSNAGIFLRLATLDEFYDTALECRWIQQWIRLAHVDEIRGSILANIASSHRVLRNISHAHDYFHDLQRPQQSSHPIRLLPLFDAALFVSSKSEYQDGFPTYALRFGTIGE